MLVRGQSSGMNEIPYFGRPPMYELGAHLDRNRRERVVDSQNPSATAICGFENPNILARVRQVGGGCESCHAAADDRHFTVEPLHERLEVSSDETVTVIQPSDVWMASS